MNFIVDGPDGVGKTEIAKEMSHRYMFDYFKMNSEIDNWQGKKFKEELLFGERRQMQLIHQLGIEMVQDRGYPSEWVYSRVLGRETDDGFLYDVDSFYAAHETLIVMPLMRNYDLARKDDLVERPLLERLHDTYLDFEEWTECHVVKMYVDELGFSINAEMAFLEDELKRTWPSFHGNLEAWKKW